MKKAIIFSLALGVLLGAMQIASANSSIYSEYEKRHIQIKKDYTNPEDYRNDQQEDAYENIRAPHFEGHEFTNEGENKLYQKNRYDLKQLPGVTVGKHCINWKNCQRLAFHATNGYNRSYQKQQIGEKKKITLERNHESKLYNGTLDNDIRGENKVMRLRFVGDYRGTKGRDGDYK